MVAPAWGSFQKPNQNDLSYPEEEFKEELPGQLKNEIQPEGHKPQWGDFQSTITYQGEPDPTADEDLLGYTVRNITANASRLAEQYFGRYGNMEKMGKDIVSNAPKTAGILGWALSELLGPERWEKMIRGKPGQEQILPTSQNLKELSEKGTGGYTKAKTPGEEKFQGVTEDIGATISGRSLQRPSLRNIGVNNILIPVAANVAKEAVDSLGFGKDKANLAKWAVWFPLSLAANINGSQYAAGLMNQGRNAFGPNIRANVPRYQSRINIVSMNMLQGDPRSALAQQQLAGINNDIANGQTTMTHLMSRYDAINAAKRDRGLFELGRSDRAAAIRNINQVRDAVRGEIEILGQASPQGLQSWQNGVMAFSTIHRSNTITNWIEGVVKGPYAKLLSGPAAALFGIGSYAGFKAPMVAGPASVAIPALYKTGQTIYRMWNDRRLANYYWRAVSAAEVENVPAFINNYNKLNNELEKSDSTKKKTESKKK